MYKRGKDTPYLGAFHNSDIPEFYGSGTAPDFIGTDALGMLVIVSVLVRLNNTRIQSILSIPVTPPLHATLKVSFPLWTGSHGTRALSIRF